MLNALTIDVEDYYQVSGFERRIARADWDRFPSRVAANTDRLLALLARRQVRATFFVLGWVARRFPQLVRRIDRAGHELGSHGFWHRLVYEQSREEFRADLRESRDAIEQAAGRAVTCYRAPSFSITRRSLWAFEVLAEERFRVDSSVFPVRHDRYGIPDAPREPHAVETPCGTVWECPLSTWRWGGLNWPVSGGGYFRLYPYALTARAIRDLHRQGRPLVFYLHPWEIDPGQPRLRAAGWLARRRHYVNLHTTEAKLERLLGEFSFGALEDALALWHAPAAAGQRPEA